ncbi:Uncharacterized protein SCG7086_AB_00530 [Chlamydiales bacterium SCGC AG-110-P3]|nr:Uncharacterized protein SCG7086_AB_00530 [Chlamydiales bacterium SCGC AG-110-P3]
MKQTLVTFERATVSAIGREQPILDNLTINFYDGDFVVVIGANGSGKSTLLKLVDERCPLTAGAVIYQQDDGAIATLTQDVDEATYPSLTVFENCRLTSSEFAIDRTQLILYLNRFHPALGDKLDDLCCTLSGGQRQALALALCLLDRPQMLLLDEHTSALDPVTQHQLMSITAKEAESVQLTMMVTHDLQDALTYGNRLIVMSNGRISGDYAEEQKQALTLTDLFGLLSQGSTDKTGGSHVCSARRAV